jgi:hypothetical protein
MLVAFSCGGKVEPDVRTQLEVGDRLYREGRFDEAGVAYLRVLEASPHSAAVLEKLGRIALLRNATEEAESYLSAAIEHSPWYRRVWPLDIGLKYALGLVYLRQDRFADLVGVFEDARGPLAVGPLRDLDGFARQMALFGDQIPYEIDAQSRTRVEFVTVDPLPVIRVSVNRREPRDFIIDTGGMELIVDDDLAAEVGAQIAGSLTGTYAGGRKAETGLGRVDSVELGELVVRNVPIHVLDTDPCSVLFPGLTIKGVVGTRLLMHFLATIDYPAGALYLEPAVPSELHRLDALVATGRAKAIPIWLSATHYILARGTVNDLEPMLFFVDTGLAGAGFKAPLPVLERAGITVDWTRAEEGVGGGGPTESVPLVVDRLALGSGEGEVVRTRVPGRASETPPAILGDRLGFYVGGLISHAFFRNSAVTFDFTQMRLVIR